MAETLGTFYLVIAVFSIVLAIAWIVLPFALIGTKPLLRQLVAETKRGNELRARTNELLELRRQARPVDAPATTLRT